MDSNNSNTKLTLAEWEETTGMHIPTLLSQAEAEVMKDYLNSKDVDGIHYTSAPCAGAWVVELWRDGQLMEAL